MPEEVTEIKRIFSIETGKVNRRKRLAMQEHMIENRAVLSVEALYIQRDQLQAITEHIIHPLHCLGIEGAAVESLHGLEAIEHIVHPFYVFGVELAKVEGRQAVAIPEHTLHVHDVTGIEVLTQIEVGQVDAILEHICHRGILGEVEFAQVKGLDMTAAVEHRTGVDKVRGPEAAQVDMAEFAVVEAYIAEHILQSSHILGIEALHVVDSGQ